MFNARMHQGRSHAAHKISRLGRSAAAAALLSAAFGAQAATGAFHGKELPNIDLVHRTVPQCVDILMREAASARMQAVHKDANTVLWEQPIQGKPWTYRVILFVVQPLASGGSHLVAEPMVLDAQRGADVTTPEDRFVLQDLFNGLRGWDQSAR